MNDEVFKEKLSAVSLKALMRTAKERRPGSIGFAEAMILEYNGRKKSSVYRLQINRLYSTDSTQSDVAGFTEENEFVEES